MRLTSHGKTVPSAEVLFRLSRFLDIPMDQLWVGEWEPKILKVGGRYTYPGHGLAVLEGIEKRIRGEKEDLCYVLKILSNGTTIILVSHSMAMVKRLCNRAILLSEEAKPVPRLL